MISKNYAYVCPYNLIFAMEDAVFFAITPKSFRKLFDLYYEPLCRSLNYYTRDAQAIEEIVQDVFVTLWEDRDRLHIEHIKTYLFSAARYRALNYLRDRQRQATFLEAWSEEELLQKQGNDVLNYDELIPQLQIAIENLPTRCRQIFDLSRKEQLTYRQIADSLNISIKTVESQMSIALRKIRDHFASNYHCG
ncbi:RNA polymerase sigma-70 factor [Microbacter margulisiae]|nr:RNA polymerase sigma-70 factor [Microbacter margulisiae]